MFLNFVFFSPLSQNIAHVSVVLLLKSLTCAGLHLVLEKGCSVHVIEFTDGNHRDELDNDIKKILLASKENEKVNLYSNGDQYLAHGKREWWKNREDIDLSLAEFILVDSISEETWMIKAILAKNEAVPDLRFDIQVHHVVRNESSKDNCVRLSRRNGKTRTSLHVPGNQDKYGHLDENDHDGTQVDVGYLVITHGNLLEKSRLAIQLLWINK